ncbi:MAG: phosphate acyltransferase PlsX [Desulfuromonadales bacterium]|nr:phosphate acyltransferase PlsX [Desulfuromonadales bacterium]MBN2792275.1 phosphate acyltransferase PlsX [Desulfuromonadales bacterium]
MSSKIAVDAMGGDYSPASEVAGAVDACRRWGCEVILVGDTQRIENELAKHVTQGLRLEIHHASEVVGMHDSASDAVRKKKDSSIRVAFNLAHQGAACAVVSAGNSGAIMASGMHVFGRVKGIERPAIGTCLPNLDDQTMVLDMGANVDCKPSHLYQFAVMGSIYVEHFFNKVKPRVGLLSNGEEEKKGNELTRDTHRLLKESQLNYLGYVEGGDVYNGSVDVVVCDGFVGNVLLKVSEGLAVAIGTMLKREIESRFLARMGYCLSRPAFEAFKHKINPAEYGGAPLLGIAGTGIVCHGSSDPVAISMAIRQAGEYAKIRIEEKLAALL